MGRRRNAGLSNMLLICLVSAISIVVKPYLRTPFSFIQSSFGMPVGAFIGGIYMFWPLVLSGIIRKPGVAFTSCVVQGLTAIVAGFTGLLGPAAFFSYLAPGVPMEILLRSTWSSNRPVSRSVMPFVLAGALGNLAGAAVNAFLFFALKAGSAAVVTGASLISGGLGGWLAWFVGNRIRKASRRNNLHLS